MLEHETPKVEQRRLLEIGDGYVNSIKRNKEYKLEGCNACKISQVTANEARSLFSRNKA